MRSPVPRYWKIAALAAALALLSAGCGVDALGGKGLRVVATTTILGDVARNVVGDGASVEVLIPVGTDPHDYQASSQQVASIQQADLVIANGLLLEEGLEDVLRSLTDDGANILELAPLLEPLPFATDADSGDPHVWFDPIRMVEAARIIATELTAISGGSQWLAQAEAYAVELVAADKQIAGILEAVPLDQRRLVTNHDALGYFAARYDFEIVGTVIPGGSTLADPSSAELAALVELLEDQGVSSIFAETTEPSVLAEAVAAELDARVEVVDLYTGSLGEPGSGAETLIELLTTNANRIAAALT
ncbi:MAG: zinc ABC transporter substrate-binding protein [Acidimicrobiia bacterium]|nr:zinc ABC transporter substrate-binding protein [Acidimicrobiia bacterium]